VHGLRAASPRRALDAHGARLARWPGPCRLDQKSPTLARLAQL